MNFQVSKASIHLFVVQVVFLLLIIVCTSQLDLQPTRDINDKTDAVNPNEQALKMKFDEDYTIKINTSNVDPNYAALCVITKDDNINDISEFLEYHFKIGIGRIYLFDTGTDNSQFQKHVQRLANFLVDGKLYYSYWNQGPWRKGFNMQVDIYNICAQSFAKNHIWFGFIDTDEFIVLRNIVQENEPNQDDKKVAGKVKNIQDFLKQYEDYGALAMNWVVFGSSGYEKHQDSALKTYTKCMLHDFVKSFVNVRYWNKRVTNVHNIPKNVLQQDKFAVDENFQVQSGMRNSRYPVSKIAVFHYIIKSAEDYNKKMQRGDASGHQARKEGYFNLVNNNANYTCTEGVQLYNQLFLSKNSTQKNM